MTPVITSASRSAAPTILPGMRPGAPDPIQLYADAHNALAMALHYLRQPAANVPGAARKAVQALAALRSLGTRNGEPIAASAGRQLAANVRPSPPAPVEAFAAWLAARQGSALQAMRSGEGEAFSDHCEAFADAACALRVLGQFELEQQREEWRTAACGRAGA